MMTAEEFRLKVIAHAATAYAIAHPTSSPKDSVQFASRLAEESVIEARRLNLLFGGDSPITAAQAPSEQPIMPPGMQGFPPATSQMTPQAAQASQAAPAAGGTVAPFTQMPMQAHPAQVKEPQMVMQPIEPPVVQAPLAPNSQGAAPNAPAAPAAAPPATTGALGTGIATQPSSLSPQPQPPPANGPVFQPLGPYGPSIPLPQQPLGGQAQGQSTPVVVPPPGPGYDPPAIIGAGTHKVTEAPMPQNYSALGGPAVKEKVEQRPMTADIVITPGNQSCVPAGGIAEVVTEKVSH
jgi:hypothetical protein